MKVALFGGTFDPVHNGHVRAAESVLRFTDCGEVWFIPVYWHALKENSMVTALEHRKKMIELAIEGKNGLRAMDFNSNPTYTVDTIKKAMVAHPKNEYVWVIGSDLVEEFSSWKDAEQILREVKIIIVPEPGFEKIESGLLSEEKGNCTVLWGAPRVQLNSTAVRERLMGGKSTKGLVDGKVLYYIKKQKLYGNGK